MVKPAVTSPINPASSRPTPPAAGGRCPNLYGKKTPGHPPSRPGRSVFGGLGGLWRRRKVVDSLAGRAGPVADRGLPPETSLHRRSGQWSSQREDFLWVDSPATPSGAAFPLSVYADSESSEVTRRYHPTLSTGSLSSTLRADFWLLRRETLATCFVVTFLPVFVSMKLLKHPSGKDHGIFQKSKKHERITFMLWIFSVQWQEALSCLCISKRISFEAAACFIFTKIFS
ncbi:uncharacterized protein LOC130545878 isoform X2 [Triplophysa rosa]|uniref:uncharacterized protein LOC130545878 isoform X2 n=1 Tax=Triplophysa rosa TaxID=992332 RepID=UPI00254620E2|nr:uncharacterized protein LOC130545878 isoform X2 [Triplophysa rosa]